MQEPVIGIDLGTTNSVIAAVEDGKPHVILSRDGKRLTPSMVGFTPRGERVVGERASMLAEEHPENVAFAAKRFIGRRWTADIAAAAREVVPYPVVAGPNNECRIKIADRTLPVTQVSAMVLGDLKLDAEAWFGRPVRNAVITVPANFDDGQRNATKEAARIAGLEVLRIVNEPTAAAVAYGLGQGFQGRALVFDLGGGTFDVSILEIANGVFEVKATGGDSHLGGEDFDNRIVQWLIAQLPERHREVVSKDPLSLQRLKAAAEKAKKELTLAEEAYLSIAELGVREAGQPLVDLDTALTRDFFEILSRPLSERCLNVCQEVMRDAGMDPRSMDAVLLVGGMTRVPLVRKLVTEFFGREPATGVNPDEVVALGAAVHALEVAQQAGKALLIDVAAHSMGVGVLGGKVKRLVRKNATIPCSVREIFHPGHAGQTLARIPIYQGESDYQDENRKLGEVVLRDLNVAARNQTPIEVVFELASDGTLSVRATDLSTGLAEATRIESRTLLSPMEETRLTQEQSNWQKKRATQDEQDLPAQFERLLQRGQKLVRLLEQSAQENPSEEATRAVGNVRATLDAGHAALKGGDPERMKEVRKALLKLLR